LCKEARFVRATTVGVRLPAVLDNLEMLNLIMGAVGEFIRVDLVDEKYQRPFSR
ncbi:hypothetical protein KI387_009394, partial [Taxus chinensis]